MFTPLDKSTRRLLSVLVLLLSTSLISVAAYANDGSEHERSRRTIVGTWEGVVDADGPMPFSAMQTFMKDGGFMSVDDGTPVRGTGQTTTTSLGTWKRTGYRTFAYKWKRFHLINGDLFLTLTLTTEVRVNKRFDEYRSEGGTLELVFAAGGQLVVPAPPIRATRFKIE